MTGALVVTPDRCVNVDVLIDDGRIAALAEEGTGRADEVLRAGGTIALPGVVDAHVHFNDPGREEWEGWLHGTRGAAAGGVTTVCDMPLNSIPPTTTVAAFEAKRAAAERSAIVDFALWGGLTPGADVAGVMARGAVGVKAFLCDPGVPEFAAVGVDDVARTDAFVAVHAEDPSLVRGRARTWSQARPEEAEVAAVRALAASGARVHVVHVSTDRALAALGPRMTAETCPHYLTFTADDVEREGAILKCAPPIRDAATRDRLWDAVLDGRLAYVASDHSPSSADRKAGTLWDAWGGIAGVQTLLPAMLTEGVHRRGLGLRRLARLTATGPARALGLSRKGAIAVGMDADLALVDPLREWTLERAALQTRSGLSPYLGRTFTGAVVATLVRGRVVYRESEFPAGPGYGRFVARG